MDPQQQQQFYFLTFDNDNQLIRRDRVNLENAAYLWREASSQRNRNLAVQRYHSYVEQECGRNQQTCGRVTFTIVPSTNGGRRTNMSKIIFDNDYNSLALLDIYYAAIRVVIDDPNGLLEEIRGRKDLDRLYHQALRAQNGNKELAIQQVRRYVQEHGNDGEEFDAAVFARNQINQFIECLHTNFHDNQLPGWGDNDDEEEEEDLHNRLDDEEEEKQDGNGRNHHGGENRDYSDNYSDNFNQAEMEDPEEDLHNRNHGGENRDNKDNVDHAEMSVDEQVGAGEQRVEQGQQQQQEKEKAEEQHQQEQHEAMENANDDEEEEEDLHNRLDDDEEEKQDGNGRNHHGGENRDYKDNVDQVEQGQQQQQEKEKAEEQHQQEQHEAMENAHIRSSGDTSNAAQGHALALRSDQETIVGRWLVFKHDYDSSFDDDLSS